MIELRLITTGEVLDLSPNATISLELHNPLFGDTVFPGAFSYSFSLAGGLTSPRNARALGFADRLDVPIEGQPVYEVELRLQGLPWQRGTLTLLSASPTRYKVKFLGEISLLSERFAQTKLGELGHEKIPLSSNVLADLDGGQYLVNITYHPAIDPRPSDISRAKNNGRGNKFIKFRFEGSIPQDPLRVVVNGEEFVYDDTVPANNQRLYNLSEMVTQSALSVEAVSYYYENPQNISDSHYVFYVYGTSEDYNEPLEVSFPDMAWSVEKRWEEDYTGLISAALSQYANHSIPEDNFVLPTFHNPDLLGEGRNTLGLHNAYNDAGDEIQLHYGEFSPETVFGVVPMFSLEYVLQRIEATTGVKITGAWRADPDVQKLIFFNEHALNVYAEDGTPALSESIDPALHLPDWTINEFMIELARLFCLGFDYQPENSTLELFPLQDVLDIPTQDRTSEASPDYQVEFEAQEGAIFAFEGIEDPQPLTIGAGKEAKTMKIGTVRTTPRADFSTSFPYAYVLPASRGEGKLGDDLGRPEDARLLFYHGKEVLLGGITYPYASSLHVGYSGTLSRFSLLWTGEKNLYETWWERWYEFEATRKSVPRTLHWTIRELLTYRHRQLYRIKERDYLLAKLKLSISQRGGLSPVQVDAYTLEP